MKEAFLGLKVVEEFTIKCKVCSKPLAMLVVSETNVERKNRGLRPQQTCYKVIGCPCGGESVSSKVFYGSTNIAPPTSVQNLDIVDTQVDNYGTIFTTMKFIDSTKG